MHAHVRCCLKKATLASVALNVCARGERRTTQAAKHSLHHLRKKRHTGPRFRESPPPKKRNRKLVEIWRVAGSPLLQTKTLRAIHFITCASSCRQLVRHICTVHIQYFPQGNYQKSAQPSPTQKGGIDAPFLNCTSEVTQWCLYINEHYCIKMNEFGVKGESEGLDMCRFPAKKVVWV